LAAQTDHPKDDPFPSPKPAMTAFALFPTAIGACALVWSDEAIVGAAFPESSDERTGRALPRAFQAPWKASRRPPSRTRSTSSSS
jgi:methylated-DNA-[protein]-cysteine S-methyltransferase